MAGLCGWIGYGASAADNRAVIEQMAPPLARFDGHAVRTAALARTALAVAAADGAALLYQRDGVLLAVWGSVVLRDPALLREAGADGIGAALVALWRRSPEQLCAALHGAFALAIVDEKSGDALLVTDRMATFPLSWRLAGESLVFGTTADAIGLHPATPHEIDPQGLYNYVYFHMIPGPGTVHRHVQRLLPGQYLSFRQGRVETRLYWNMQFAEGGGESFGALKEQFTGLLRSSVAEAAEGASTGAFLSGGTDSSTISGMLTQVQGKPAKTYSIGFEAQGYDEMEYARIAARHFGTEHHEYYVTPDDVVAAIPQVAAVHDQPFGNASAVPAFYCARMARADGITRMLGGDGGDELFGGNERYSKQHVFAIYDKVPAIVRKALLEPVVFNFPAGGALKVVRKARSYIEQANVGMPARLETYNLLGRYGPTQVFSDSFLQETDSAHPLACLERDYGRSEAKSLINKMLALDFKITLADNDLPKVVRSCELAGVDAAFPFLNDAMVAFSARLTPQQKLNGTQLRWFFKEALKDFLPQEIITKQKHGFGLPFGVWLQHHPKLQQLATDSLSDLRRRGVVRPAFIDQLLGQHLKEHAGYHGTMVWVLMMMEQWFRQRPPQA
jgi:asparagine synthase (glutamine-hydrolysing)